MAFEYKNYTTFLDKLKTLLNRRVFNLKYTKT